MQHDEYIRAQTVMLEAELSDARCTLDYVQKKLDVSTKVIRDAKNIAFAVSKKLEEALQLKDIWVKWNNGEDIDIPEHMWNDETGEPVKHLEWEDVK